MNFQTLTEALDAAAGRAGAGFSHLSDERQPIRAIPYAELAVSARRIAAALQRSGLSPGDRVGLILPESADFIEAIFGCMYAGMIAVPIYPPLNPGQIENYLTNTTHILRRAGCRLVITDGRVRPILGTLLGAVPSLRAIEDRATLLTRADGGFAEVKIRPDDVAFLQFTSGSTSSPKGVTLTHANLLANVDAIGGALGVGWHEDGPSVSWLPLYHDMGLIGFVFGGVRFAAAKILFMSPLIFLKRPALWLRHLSEIQARVTFAPNFAYGLCAHRVKESEIAGIDLSHLRVAGCGAEPIQRATLDAFATRYAPYGFSRRALLPCYGMAEHSLAVSFIGLDEELRADRVDPAALAQGQALPVAEGGLEIVSCGRPLPDHSVQIVDPEGSPLPEGQVGQISLAGPSVMRGYWEDPARTAATMRGGRLATGDLGYMREGQLYVCGRIKDLIIVQGRNFHPTDLEWQASQVEGVRRGNVVAFSLPDEGRERVIVAAEVRDPADPERLRGEVTARILSGLALRVDEVLLLAPGSLPKTSSGKLQRARTAELYAKGELGQGGSGRIGLIKQITASQWSYFKARFASKDAV